MSAATVAALFFSADVFRSMLATAARSLGDAFQCKLCEAAPAEATVRIPVWAPATARSTTIKLPPDCRGRTVFHATVKRGVQPFVTSHLPGYGVDEVVAVLLEAGAAPCLVLPSTLHAPSCVRSATSELHSCFVDPPRSADLPGLALQTLRALELVQLHVPRALWEERSPHGRVGELNPNALEVLADLVRWMLRYNASTVAAQSRIPARVRADIAARLGASCAAATASSQRLLVA